MAGTLVSNNPFPSILITEGTVPTTPAAGKQRLYIDSTTHVLKVVNSSGTASNVATAASGSITASGYTQSTARLLGRTTASSGAVEEITVGSGLSLSAGALTATGGTSLVGSAVNITLGDYTSKTSTTFADLDATNLSLTVTTGAHRVLIGVVCTGAIAVAPQSICLDVIVDSTREGGTFGLQAVDPTSSTKAVNLSFVHMTAALTAASHTFKVQYRVTGSAASFYASSSITPFGFWVQEMPF